MPSTRRLFALTLVCSNVLAVAAQAQVPSAGRQQFAVASAAETTQMSISKVPPEMTQRFTVLYGALQAAVKAWVVQQARLEAHKPGPDESGLEKTIHSRFPALNSASSQDVDALVFLVLMQATTDGDQDLQNQMAQAQAQTQAKQAVRDLLNKLSAEQAALARSGSTGSTGATLQCRSQFCHSLPQRLADVNAMMSRVAGPPLSEVQLQVPPNPTAAQLNQVASALQNKLDSMNDLSEQGSMQLQMTMDRRSKLLATLSNLMKTISASADTILQNLK